MKILHKQRKEVKRMRTIQKTLFYMSSFIPLYLLLIVQNFKFRNESGKFSWQTIFDQINFSNKIITLFWIGLIVMIILSLFGCVIFFKIYGAKEGRNGSISDAEFVREDTMGYIVTYIIPLLSMDITSLRSLVVNLLLFIIIGTFYVKNDQIFMNPLYNLFGYNIFSAESGIYITKISKQKLKLFAKRDVKVKKINIMGDIYVLKENE
ncbi:TPA: hypothetical protein KG967_000909 [Enterococcus faecalis]|nr:hypothetical protein HMPREF9377_01593 [Enterococcus faecalis R712]EFE20462.1 hypothetical protein HMPREF9376_00538 [Enterococcus faecalis S613]EFQ11167.1 hypothetical protein HMPREF9492_00557 [Enterococcus faecalis DAPTO 512]EFQ68813.1 hypothetical protein HMPREF9493_00645 [Enterococcus faecalis DAPTO 516]EGO2628961.1 hypothetical protein [Enterococcus faecalis]MBU5663145.1 hypothetical protein [Enterococcus sp. S183_ASV_20]HAP4961649.1 hypothetical protein [Enterococcus faecalis ADL-336]